MEDEVWIFTLRARPSAVPIRSRINAVLKYAARRDLRCIRLEGESMQMPVNLTVLLFKETLSRQWVIELQAVGKRMSVYRSAPDIKSVAEAKAKELAVFLNIPFLEEKS